MLTPRDMLHQGLVSRGQGHVEWQEVDRPALPSERNRKPVLLLTRCVFLVAVLGLAWCACLLFDKVKSPPASVRSEESGRRKLSVLPTPSELRRRLPTPLAMYRFIVSSREQAASILRGDDDRLLVVVGPCSIHDPIAAHDYAKRLHEVSEEFQDTLLVMMRTYLEKPRTSVGWKGFVSDPDLTGAEDLGRGIVLGRKILLDVNAAKLPVAVEFLDPLVAPYFEDLVSYGSIGARTVESPTHRALVADLKMPVGFKNARSGDVQSAVNAMVAASKPQRRLATDANGKLTIVQAPGNLDGHIILRGGDSGPNYGNLSATDATEKLKKAGFSSSRVVVDCSHGNSGKRYEGQVVACQSVASQIAAGSQLVGGVMIESFIEAGNQQLEPGVTNLSELNYGCSVTDACLDFESTKALIRDLSAAVATRRSLQTQPWREINAKK